MRKRLLKAGGFLLAVGLVLGYGFYWAFYDIQRIRGQEMLAQSSSPSGVYTVTAYLNNGGATTSYAVLCTLRNNNTGRYKNIYWNYRCDYANISWSGDKTVIINGVRLDVDKDTYDFRRS